MERKRSTQRVALAILLLSAGSTPALARDPGWDWMIEPYLWGASIGTDMRTFEPPTSADSDSSFYPDVIDKLDGIFMVRVEGRNDRFGMFADFLYLGLGDDTQHRVLSTRTDLDARLLDAAFSMRFGGERYSGLDVFGGLRWIDLDMTVRFEPDNPAFEPRTLDAGRHYADFLVGARYAWQLSERWGMNVRADGSLGQTEGTWSASLMGNYLTGNGTWMFGYRYMEAELGNDNSDVKLSLSGPLLGYAFRF